MRLPLCLAFFVCLFVVALEDARGAFKSSKHETTEIPGSNPAPLADDIVVPMPCGEEIVLRGVSISAKSLMQDRNFNMGLANVPVDLRNIYEKKRESYIAGSFTAANLPGDWRNKLNIRDNGKSGGNGVETWYFIGKYELTNRQWDSVMNALDKEGNENPSACPAPNAKNANLPITSVSWFDVQEFLNKYNAWLVKNHKQSLPSFSGTSNIAFFRLPTEEEWEYAARGGNRVDPDWWESHDIFPTEEGKSIKDYGIFMDGGSAKSAPLPIGKRTGNPLGLYDTVGNAREMVDGFFRMTVPDFVNGDIQSRLHGSVGGFLSKGGSFRSEKDDILPGSREEHPLYTARGAFNADDLGFRLALAGLNIPDSDRKKKLLEAQKIAPARPANAKPKTPDLRNDEPILALETLAATSDEDLKRNLLQIREKIKDEKAALEQDNMRKMELSLKGLLYQTETLRAYALRYVSAINNRNKAIELKNKTKDKVAYKQAEELIASGTRYMADFMKTIELGANFYKISLESIYNQGAEDAERILNDLKKGYDKKTIFGDHMLQNIDALEKFIKQAQSSGISSISQNTILKGLLPANHYKIIRPKG